MTKIFTYYSPLPGRSPENDYRLMLMWRRNWAQYGFEPIVLNEWHARKHPRFVEFNERIAKLPTVNQLEYERACYLRHLAYSVVGGGWCADYDCFTYANPLKPGFIFTNPSALLPDQVMCFQGHVPSLLIGNSKAFETVISAIMDYIVTPEDVQEFGRPHVSDMHVFKAARFSYLQLNYVRNYGELHWEKFPFTHWSSGSMRNHLPKWQHIPNLRKP